MTRKEAQERLNSLRNKTKEIHILDALEILGLIKFEEKKHENSKI